MPKKSEIDLDSPEIYKKMRAVSPWYWAVFDKVRLHNGPYRHEGHEFLKDYLDDMSRIQAMTKGTQLGFSTAEIIRAFHACIYNVVRSGILYYFPRMKMAETFNSTKFKPLLTQNPDTIGQFIGDVNRVDLVNVNKKDIYFLSANIGDSTDGGEKSRIGAKSITVDRIVYDEVDEMSDSIVNTSKGRLGNSDLGQQFFIGNPTIPGYGIDKLFIESDQMYWELKCGGCGKYTNMELEFPRCLKRQIDGSVKRVCVHCGHEVFPKDGKWAALYPGKEIRGRRISRLHSLAATNDPKYILDDYEDPKCDMVSFHRDVLGMAYVEAENKLSQAEVLRCCSQDSNTTRKATWPPCAMGVDVKKRALHAVVGFPIPEKEAYKVVKLVRVADLNDLHELARQYDVRSAVIDAAPEPRLSREFQESQDFEVYLAQYQERLKNESSFDDKSGVITLHRTSALDRSHAIVVKPGGLEIPRMCEEVKRFAYEMCNTAKELSEDPESGLALYRYRKIGDDDYRHAFSYFLHACDNMGYVAEVERGQRGFGMGRRKDAERNKNWNPLKKRRAA